MNSNGSSNCSPIPRASTTRRSRISRSGGRSSFAPAPWPRSRRPPAAARLDGERRGPLRAREWGERQLLLRALAGNDGNEIPPVPANAKEDWSGSPLAREVHASWRRASRPARLTRAELEALDAGLQPLVRERSTGPRSRRGPRFGPRSSNGRRRRSPSTSSASAAASSIRRSGNGDARRQPDRGGGRARRRALVSRPRSVLVVGDLGVGKTTLIIEALRRLGDDGSRSRQARATSNAGQAFVGMLERGCRRSSTCSRNGRSSGCSRLRGGALVGTAHAEPARRPRRAPPRRRGRDAAVVGEIDPRAYERAADLRRIARLFEVVRVSLPPMRCDRGRAGLGGENELDVDDETLAEAFDSRPTICRRRTPGNSCALELVRDRVARASRLRSTGNGDRDAQRCDGAASARARPEGAAELDGSVPTSRARPRTAAGGRMPRRRSHSSRQASPIRSGRSESSSSSAPPAPARPRSRRPSAPLSSAPDRLLRLDMSEHPTPESLDRLLGDAKSGSRRPPADRRGPNSLSRPPARRVRKGTRRSGTTSSRSSTTAV